MLDSIQLSAYPLSIFACNIHSFPKLEKRNLEEVLLGRTPYDDREAFDRLFDPAKFHTHALVYIAQQSRNQVSFHGVAPSTNPPCPPLPKGGWGGFQRWVSRMDLLYTI